MISLCDKAIKAGYAHGTRGLRHKGAEELSVCRRKLNEFEKGPRDEAK